MTDKELIEKEIKRRVESMNSCPFKTAELGSEKFDDGELYAYKQILQFIDSLPEEPASEELEEEIESYIKDSLAIKFPTTDKEQIKADIRYIARHFAEWQKQQMIEKACELYRKELVALNNLLVAYDKEAFEKWMLIDDSVNDFRNTLKKSMKGE